MREVPMIGAIFGRLTVVADAGIVSSRKRAWRCRCSCGRERIVRANNLRSGGSKSCGSCEKSDHPRRKRPRWHSARPEYRAWRSMINRCTRTSQKDYPAYGGRGIRVCDRWMHSFAAFMEDMGERPDGMSLDRIDNDGNYEPHNCRWATAEQQMNNRRANHVLTLDGDTMTMAQWARRIGISRSLMAWRIEAWGSERALRTPPR